MLTKLNTKLFRLLYLPNESTPFGQIGPRAAFEEMLSDKTLDGYEVFSFLQEADSIGNVKKTVEKLVNIAQEFNPTVIIWQHIDRFPIKKTDIEALLRLPSRPYLVYHEGDAYGRYRKRITNSMRLLAQHAHLTFLIGLGDLAQIFKEAGAKEIIYAPHCADTTRFGKSWIPKEPQQNNVVMIGNLIDHNPVFRSIPFLRFPGALERKTLAERVYKRIGKRLRVYGQGWERYPFAAGHIPFDDQEKVLRQNLFSINWDHFPNLPFYFSDRLPISMISGIPHMTNYHPGYEILFKNGEQLVYYHNIDEAVDLVDWMLCQSPKYLEEIGKAGEDYIRKHLTANIVFRGMVEKIKQNIQNQTTE